MHLLVTYIAPMDYCEMYLNWHHNGHSYSSEKKNYHASRWDTDMLSYSRRPLSYSSVKNLVYASQSSLSVRTNSNETEGGLVYPRQRCDLDVILTVSIIGHSLMFSCPAPGRGEFSNS